MKSQTNLKSYQIGLFASDTYSWVIKNIIFDHVSGITSLLLSDYKICRQLWQARNLRLIEKQWPDWIVYLGVTCPRMLKKSMWPQD